MKAFNLIRILVLAAVLSACGGGGGGGEDKSLADRGEAVDGVYSGYLTSDRFGRTYPLAGYVSKSGHAHFYNRTTSEQIVMPLQVSGDHFSGVIGVYQPTDPLILSSLRTSGTVQGTVHARDSISGDFQTGDGDHGTFLLTYDRAIYERNSRVKQLAGVWGTSSAEDRYSISVTIRDDGSLVGSDNKGCVYGGTLSVPDSRFNAYDAAVSVTCSKGSYTASGWAVLYPAKDSTPDSIDDLKSVESIRFSFANQQLAYFSQLTKM